ncbi:hypothetical protein [Dyadobacter sp. 32]|uniref:hypothetical protein n=1 Tax=Dyadobacter sp. 32 TaxID=538966 RepID=UPI0039C5F057
MNNPRLKYRGATLNQTQIIKFLIEKEKVYELAKKISEEGYFVGEAPIICIEDEKKIVLEGNRRTAALKILQDPTKYLPKVKANILLKTIKANNFPVDKKLNCWISPNRLLANPIIYSRHNGTSLERWKTGNQYAFVAEMYYDHGLSIENICEVLNVSKSRIIKPLKTYNLFIEGQNMLEKEAGILLEISDFDFTNLERFYTYEDARILLGIDFNDDDGELIIKLQKDEFEKRLLVVFKRLLDSERFSRDFNKDDQKKLYLDDLRKNSGFDLTVKGETPTTISRGLKTKNSLEEQKNKTTTRRKQNQVKNNNYNFTISKEVNIEFDNDKLNDLFFELKQLPFDKKYSFAILLRTYLEQVLSYYISQKSLLLVINTKNTEEKKKSGSDKVDQLIAALSKAYKFDRDLDKELFMRILRFDKDPTYSSLSLKTMLDFLKNHELPRLINDPGMLRNFGQQIDNIKNELDLAVHNIHTIIDSSHNKRAWSHLHPLFTVLSDELRKVPE